MILFPAPNWPVFGQNLIIKWSQGDHIHVNSQNSKKRTRDFVRTNQIKFMVFSIFLPVRSKQNWIESNYRSGWKWLHVPSSFSFPGNNFSFYYVLSIFLYFLKCQPGGVRDVQLSLRPCFLHLLDRKDSKVGLQIERALLMDDMFRTLFWLVKDATRWCNCGSLPQRFSLRSHINWSERVHQNCTIAVLSS